MEKLKIEKIDSNWLEFRLGNIIVSGKSLEPSYIIELGVNVDVKTLKKSCNMKSLYVSSKDLIMPCGEISDDIYGIVLTRDLLVNFCGFKQCKGNPLKYSRVVENVYLFIEFSEISECFYYRDIRLKYLHDLQNICWMVTETDFMLADFGQCLTDTMKKDTKDNNQPSGLKFLTIMAIILLFSPLISYLAGLLISTFKN